MKKWFIRFCSLAAVVLIVSGCSPAAYVEDNANRDRVLDQHFTAEAARSLKAVPLRVGPLAENIAGLAVGDDIGSRLIAFTFGYPMENQVIIAPGSGDRTIFHEYVHHADYLGLITRQAFAAGAMSPDLDPEQAAVLNGIRAEIIEVYNASPLSALALIYDDGLNREWLAFAAENYAFEETPGWPQALVTVYQPALRIAEVD